MELEYIRSCVSTALADVHYRQRGILEVQLEQMRLGRSGRFNNKPVRSISVGMITHTKCPFLLSRLDSIRENI